VRRHQSSGRLGSWPDGRLQPLYKVGASWYRGSLLTLTLTLTLTKVGLGTAAPLSVELSESVQAIRLLATSMPPRVVPVRVSSEPPTVVFTDAAFEGGRGTIGVVVKRPGRGLAWTACDCPGWVLSAFRAVDRAKERYIGQLELLAAVVAYTTFPDLLAGQHVIHWIDNESVPSTRWSRDTAAQPIRRAWSISSIP